MKNSSSLDYSKRRIKEESRVSLLLLRARASEPIVGRIRLCRRIEINFEDFLLGRMAGLIIVGGCDVARSID